jgi:hypothetical protein
LQASLLCTERSANRAVKVFHGARRRVRGCQEGSESLRYPAAVTELNSASTASPGTRPLSGNALQRVSAKMGAGHPRRGGTALPQSDVGPPKRGHEGSRLHRGRRVRASRGRGRPLVPAAPRRRRRADLPALATAWAARSPHESPQTSLLSPGWSSWPAERSRCTGSPSGTSATSPRYTSIRLPLPTPPSKR